MADDASESSEEEGGVDSQGFWEAEAIVRASSRAGRLPFRQLNLFRRSAQLDETRSQYLIAWKGVDEKGNRWKPTWVRHPSSTLGVTLNF